MLKDFKSEMAWLSSSEAKQRSDAAKALAISEFKKRFPRADVSRFQVKVDFDPNRKAMVMVMVMVMVYFCHYTLKKYIIMYNVHRIKGKKWREGP